MEITNEMVYKAVYNALSAYKTLIAEAVILELRHEVQLRRDNDLKIAMDYEHREMK